MKSYVRHGTAECSLRIKFRVKSLFICIISFNSHNNPMKQVLLMLIRFDS